MTSIKMTLGLALLILSQTAVNAVPVLQSGVSLASRQNAGTGAGCDSIFTDTDTATGQGVKNAEDNTANLISGTKGGNLRRQNAGTGAACNSIFTDTDTATGQGVKNAEDNTANLISGTKGGNLRRQNAGTGAACNSIFTDTDTATGQGVKNAEDNTANLISGTKGSIPKRQENKIADGAADILNAAGAKQVAGPVKTIGDSTDGDTTKDLANTGAEVGQLELDTIPTLGSAIPKHRRQENKIADGAADILDAAGEKQIGGVVKTFGDTTDGEETKDLANTGATVGQLELNTIPKVGSAVP